MNFILATLLFQLTAALTETPDAEWDLNTTPDSSVRYGEFCLPIPDDNQPITLTTKQATRLAKQATQQTTESVKPTKQTNQPTEQSTPLQVVSEEQILPAVHAPLNFRAKPTRGCRCQNRNKKLPNETSPVVSTKIWHPAARCNSTEIMETLKDGRKVCVNAPSILSYITSTYIRSSPFTAPKSASHHHGPPVTTPAAPQEPNSESTITTPPPDTEMYNFYYDEDAEGIGLTEAVTERGEGDYEAVTLAAEDQETTQINGLTEAVTERSDSPFETGISSAVDMILDNRDQAIKQVNGLADAVMEAERSHFETEIAETLVQKGVSDLVRESVREKQMDYAEKVLVREVEAAPLCVRCISLIKWDDVDPKAVQSLDIQAPHSRCPVLIHIKLKGSRGFCFDSSEPWFSMALERLEIHP